MKSKGTVNEQQGWASLWHKLQKQLEPIVGELALENMLAAAEEEKELAGPGAFGHDGHFRIAVSVDGMYGCWVGEGGVLQEYR